MLTASKTRTRTRIGNFFATATVAMTLMVTASSVNAAMIVTDFGTDNTTDYIDGYGSGFQAFSGGSGFDTTQGWTFYIDNSFSTVNTISIPFEGSGGGSVTMGELEIREGYELLADVFWLTAGTTHTLALRSNDYSVGAGDASIDWAQEAGGTLNAYYSQDSGSSWTAATKGVDFTATEGTLQFLIARNAGANEDPSIDTVTVSHQVIPEPGSLALGLVGLTLIALRRRR